MSRESIVRFICDLCQGAVQEDMPDHNDVEAVKSPKGWASARNSDKHYSYRDMCPKCVKKIHKALKEAEA